ncbi:MAG: glycosyltransferase family 4 protein, partial [Marinobacter sp.]
MRTSILIMFHCKQDTGYAISSLEKAFKQAATEAGFSEENILWSYKEVADKEPQAFQLDYYSENDAMNLRNIIEEYQISTILAFDLPYPSPVVRAARAMNVEKVVAYWGASMSSINSGLKLFLRRFQWILQARSAPDFFIFESNAMLRTATHGRGVPKSRTTVIPLGVNTDTYYPDPHDRSAYRLFNIPETRKIIFYSGHMEERKGVRVLINAMLELEKRKKLEPFHLLICGNKGNQSEPYESMLQSSQALEHVTFAGYRKDVPQLMRSAYIGTIASTGWDSFTMSSVEMLSSGLPLIVSELQG